MSETQVPPRAPLDEVMLAMDVVDTLRHRELIVQRELSADDRDRQLIDRLREIYSGQGIEVTDAILERGVRDLRENRFLYKAPPPSLSRALARLYVTRDRWGPLLGFGLAVLGAVLIGYQVLVRGPQLEAIAALPSELEQTYAAVIDVSEVPEIDARAAVLYGDGRRALDAGELPAAREAIAELESLQTVLAREYRLRVVSRPGELSGVWRIPDDSPSAQNFYLIVEALDADGERLTLPIESEEDGRIRRVAQWGQRVEEAKFRAVANDKQDDGIIQDDIIGAKARGFVEPELSPGVLSGAITSW